MSLEIAETSLPIDFERQLVRRLEMNATLPACRASSPPPRAALRTLRGRPFLTLGCALITWRYLKREF
jgi:hypothetical protein